MNDAKPIYFIPQKIFNFGNGIHFNIFIYSRNQFHAQAYRSKYNKKNSDVWPKF